MLLWQQHSRCHTPLSHGSQFESQENKKLCFCSSSLALDERLDGQNLLFQDCMIKIYSVSFMMYIFGAKFQELCHNISGDILDSVFYCLGRTISDVITFLICIIQKREYR